MALIVATVASLTVHVPPGTASVSVVAEPRQMFAEPDIVPGSGNGFTSIDAVAKADAHALVTV